ncbi:MAG: NAD(P)-dependent glycerol-3-phosphate dehydrogenase [Dehalococcoidales bacterium]|nr:NAD(P)-dependent glycerol-3-phosphate dehydrogenase [Dehalococcoidales bacterium]
MPEIAVIGTTSWGKTLGLVLARKGRRVALWARTEAEAVELREGRSGAGRTFSFPPQLSVTSFLSEALASAQAVILAVPSQAMRRNVSLVKDYLTGGMLVVSAAKGLELESNKRMSQVIAEEIAPEFHSNICVLSGPNLSREIVHDLPAATVIAAESEAVAVRAQKLLSTGNFCIYTNTDVIGVELAGALKNIIALGAGMVDGLGFGDNTKAAFVTRGLIEITALGVALGAHPLTFTGLAGLGDTIATCASPLSRNHYLGAELAKGRPLKEITASMTGIAEGVSTTVAARDLARQHRLGMPVTEKIYQVLFEGVHPRQVVAEITSSDASHELAGQNWAFSDFSLNRKHD